MHLSCTCVSHSREDSTQLLTGLCASTSALEVTSGDSDVNDYIPLYPHVVKDLGEHTHWNSCQERWDKSTCLVQEF